MSDKQKNFNDTPKSYWIASAEQASYPGLKGDITTDICIIGGGITGITLSALLKDKGAKFVLIEKGRILNRTTGHTTAKITSQHRLIYKYLIDNFGRERAKQYADANQSAVDFIVKTAKNMKIECDLNILPAYVYTCFDSFQSVIEDEVNAAKSLGLPAAYADNLNLPFKTKCAVKFDNQAQFHPLKYLIHLSNTIKGRNMTIYENTRAVKIDEEQQGVKIKTDKGSIKAKIAVLASQYPFHDKPGMYFARMKCSRSYIAASYVNKKLTPGMYISGEDPVRSIRTQPAGKSELLLAGGEGHITGHTDNTEINYKTLIKFTDENFSIKSLEYRWSAQDYVSIDNIPYIGNLTPKKDNIFVATGMKKWGMSGGTAAAMIICDLIMGRKNPWLEVFNPSRFDLSASSKELIKNTVYVGKEFIKGKISTGSPNFQDIEKSGGKIVRQASGKVAVYRDIDGKLHTHDATCTHMGCEVVWNEAEKTWDCPCHGSRFSHSGKLIEGAAVKDLKKI